jgi:hypothetical protein
MNTKRVAEIMIPLILGTNGLPKTHHEYGKTHLIEMCLKIYDGSVFGDQANRWIGWIQAAICIAGGITVEKLKEINKIEQEK